MSWLHRLFGTIAFAALKAYIKFQQKTQWWDTVDTWEALISFAEDVTDCRCLETRWHTGEVTRSQ